MAWAALTSALKTIGEEAAYLWGVEDQVKRLEKELKWMQDFLGNNGTNHLQADEIRELAYDAEDVLETFALEIGSKTRPGFTNRIKRYACFLHELWLLHETRSNIEKIIAKSKDLVRRLSAYCLKESRSGGEGPSSSIMQEQRWQRTHRLGDDEIVGRRDDIDKLVPVVVDEKSEWRVVSIYGMGEVASLESHPHKLQCLDEVESWELFRMVTFPQADSPGIVPSKQEWEIAEDVAEGYLMELAERNMIEPRERDVATLKIKTFQLHDIMRDICLSKAKQENFLFIVDQSNALSSSTIREARRISAHKLFETQRIECPNLRSLSFFGIFSRKGGARLIWIGERTLLNRIRYTWKIVYNPFPKARWFWTSYIFTNLKLLRVLNYEGEIAFLNCRFIGDIGNLIHLRFLRLKNIRFKGSEFPSSLGDLICLETLDLRVSGNEPEPMHVPDVIWRMEQLRHLYLPCECDEETKLKLGTLRNLQTLVNFNTEYCYVEDLINMTNIRKLKIRGPFKIEHFDMEDLNKNPPIIEGRYLQSLSISSYTMYPRHLTHLLSSCVNISKLKLEGRGCKLPERCHLSPNLAYIKLKRCKLEEDPMPTLETLRNLRVLELHHTLERLKIHCSAQGFPKLESLSLCAPHLTEWKVNKGAMPCLRGLEIVLCKSLKGLPNGLRFITTLQELKIISMPEEFKDRVVQGGRDFHKVQHVPSVIFEDQGQCPLYG
ncbi:hypothetical protein V6N11_079189 [Hibiscus sabdariffa]|uniref:Rx N-terminal domain-containing protein n=1 Tax=Hibiscus sabdariffa TaxID=183260 RepID=A0ABR2RV11_9ROSI